MQFKRNGMSMKTQREVQGNYQTCYPRPEIYIQSALNNSNETHTFICLGRSGNAKNALKFKYVI